MPINFKFNCTVNQDDFLEVKQEGDFIIVKGTQDDDKQHFYLDIPTAIKLTKTLRSKINEVKEVQNG
jgi:hypothetical protein